MSAFHYVAVTAAGKEQKGVIEADNERQARQQLRDNHLIPLSIKATQQKKSQTKNSFNFNFFRAPSLSAKELAFLTRQIATLLKAGMPLEEVLLAVSEQAEKARLKGLVLSVRGKVLEGHALASAMSEYSQAFPNWYSATVAAGERSGHLDQVLLRLADYTEQQWKMRQKVQMALIYPVMIVLVALGIVTFLLEYVVPKMVSIYGQLNQSLPTMTAVLISISSGIKAWGIYIILILIIGVIMLRRAIKRSEQFKAKVHKFMLRVPGVGYMVRVTNTARFARTLSLLSAAGVPLLEAMAISAKLVTCIPIRDSLEIASQRVREGAAMHLALKQTSYFQPLSVHLIASGETSGQLEAMLERVSQHQEEEMASVIEVGLALFEPAMILIMGAIVLFIVLAVLLPIFQLNQLSI